jgi:hypothetical protein
MHLSLGSNACLFTPADCGCMAFLSAYSDIIYALALQKLRHGGAAMVVCPCCGCCKGVWYASGWKVAKRCAVGFGVARVVELSRWEVQLTPWSERKLGPAWRGLRVSEVRLERSAWKSEVRVESLALVCSCMVAPLLTMLRISILLGIWQWMPINGNGTTSCEGVHQRDGCAS